jgi:hypothetical protein
MAKYAEDTTVTADRSRAEIERILLRYGADGFMYGWEGERAVVAFRAHDKMLRFIVPLPDRNAPEFARTATGRRRTANSEQEAYEQAVRQRWRALALVIKAKLEAVESGIESFEQAFLANILLPDGQTVGQWMVPQVEQAYLTGKMPGLLPMLGDGRREET